MADKLFRVILQVADLDKAAQFYAKLLDDPGRRIPRASRHYIDCGPVILALVAPSGGEEPAQPLPDYIYFAVGDLELRIPPIAVRAGGRGMAMEVGGRVRHVRWHSRSPS